MQKTIKLSLILGALLSQLHADNQYQLNNISVTASQGTALDKRDVTDSTVIITKEALEESRISNLAEALNKLGNIGMTQNGGIGSTTSLFLRGMDSKRTLVLIDGVRFNSPASTGIDYSHLMLHDVEQIEIIKGAQSGIWGGDASAGVINIVTSKAKKGFNAVANVEYGSFATVNTSVQASYATQAYDVLIGSSILDTNGFSKAEPTKTSSNYAKNQGDLNLEDDSYNNKSFNAKLGINLTAQDRIELSIKTINSFVEFDSGAGSDSDVPQSYLKDRFYSVAYKHTGDTHDIQAQYNLSTFDQDGKTTFGDYELKGSVNEMRLTDKIDYLKDSFVRFGVSHQEHEQVGVTSARTDKRFRNTSVFLTNYNKFNLFGTKETIITESIRYDKYDKFENSKTGKLGVKQFLHNDLYISANIGTGFNTPTLGQLYGRFGANPDLKPEKSLTSDITLGNDTVWITGFRTEVEDLIEFTTAYVQVEGTSTFKGIEIGYEDFLFDYVGVKGMYTYLEAKSADNQNLQRRPKHQIDVNVAYYISNSLDVGINAQYIGERYNSKDNGGAQTGKYFVSNLTTNYKTSENITLYAKINNLTDKHYQTVDGYATAERSIYLGLNAKF